MQTVSAAADAATSAAPLHRRLALYEDLNARLNLQLQQLLRLPQNDLQSFGARMQDPDIAVPLLQCYDAALSEKQEQLDAAKTELSNAKSSLRSAQAGHDDAVHAARLAEELARATSERLRDDHRRFQEQFDVLQGELHQMKQKAQQLVESESSLQAQVAVEKQRANDLSEALERAKFDQTATEESLTAVQRKLRAFKQTDDEERFASETQKVQLQLVAKENDDKLAEIERLRGKMVSALRQQHDNHAAHLRIVEDKHRSVVESLREELRSQEVQMLKLRAQLARVEVSSPLGGGQLVKTTTEILEMQSRQAQEFEIKRLYAEITAAQLQRDDAVYRYDQLIASRKTDADDKVAEVRRELEHQRARNAELEERLEHLHSELTTTRDQLRGQKEKTKSMQSELHLMTAERESAQRRSESAKKALAHSEALLEQMRSEKDEALSREKRTMQSTERRSLDARQDDAAAREALKAAADDAQRQADAAQAQCNDLLLAKQQLLAQLQDKERALDVQNGKFEKVALGLQACKDQLVQCDERLVAYAHLEVQWKRDGRQLALTVEQLRMECARATRERDRLAQELRSRKF